MYRRQTSHLVSQEVPRACILILDIMIALYHTSSNINASKGILFAVAATNLTVASEVALAFSSAVSRPWRELPLACPYGT
jgi:hypothetical protein